VAGEGNMDADSRVVLEEIRGNIKRIFDHFARYAEDKLLTERRLNDHSSRLTLLENEQQQRVGMGKAVKWAYMAIGGGAVTAIIGAVAFVARQLGG
jgi:hypothetical protein